MKKLLVLLCLAALFLAGCGDDGGGSGDVDTASESSDDKAGDTNFSGKGGDDFCDLAKKYEEDFEDTGEAGESTDIEKEFTELTAAIDKLADEAPGEIEDDTKKIAEAFGEYNDLLKKYDYDFSKIPESESEEISIENPDVEAASNRVESYFEKVCKMDSDGDGDTDGVIDDDSGDDGSGEEDPAGGTSETELPEDEQAPADETESTTGE